jgi:hypothetical protein
MNDQRSRWIFAAVVLPLLLAGCGDDATELDLVAGGGDDPAGLTAEAVQLRGYPADLAVNDGTAYLLSFDDTESRRLITVDADGSVTTVEVPASSRYLAVGPEGAVYVASDDTIYQMEGQNAVPVVVTSESAEGGVGAVTTEGPIEGLDADGDDRLVWAEPFLADARGDSQLSLVRVMRLEGDQVRHVAGATSVDVSDDEMMRMQTAPPQGVGAMDLPHRYTGSGGALAADNDGSIYLGGNESVLRIDGDEIEVVVGPGERTAPDEPFGDRREADNFGGLWTGASMDVSGGALVATDLSLEGEGVDVGPFDWSGGLDDGGQLVAAKITHVPRADGSFDLDSDRTRYGAAAVLVRDSSAGTALVRVSKVALDGDVLYAVGQTRTRDSSQTEDAEMLIVKLEVPG